MGDERCQGSCRDFPDLTATAKGLGDCGSMGHSGSEHWRIDCQGERRRTMKPATNVLQRANAILLLIMTAAAMPSCQSEEERKNEEQRDELRSAIEVIEKNQQDHITTQREYVELHEKYKFEKSILATKTPREIERGRNSNEASKSTATAGKTACARRSATRAEKS